MVIPPSSRRGRLIVAEKQMRRRISGRGRVIAGQAAIVAALIAIVYGTFLQPDDPSTPSGIDATAPQAQDSEGERADKRGEGSESPSLGGDSEQVGSGSAPGGRDAGAALGLATTTTPPGTTPADHQYSDTLSVLKDQLGLTDAVADRMRRR